ncbi:MAG: gamma-glutamylcyclotransferase [Actinomycetota bacterium]|nr:gamma-glutamylcyclotransferase [Actinomycetota bacterium]
MPRGTFVFGYGSLAIESGLVPGRRCAADGFVADLPGFQRSWGVAMDNRRDLPGYKYYTDDRGRRPDVYVAYLDLRERAQASVNGICIPVDDGRLAELDARERNYERVDVSDRLGVDGVRVWTYTGSTAGHRRLAEGRECGRAVIDADYLGLVRNAFRRLGPAEYEACAVSLAPGDLPVVELTRVELAPAL